METNETDRTMLDLLILFLENLYIFTQSLVKQVIQLFDKGIKNVRIAELLDAVNERLSVHPPLKCLVFAAAISCVIPVAMFVIFGITTAVIMFAGFLFIEGNLQQTSRSERTLLAVGGLCMLICIGTLLLVLSAFAVMLGVAYMLALKLGYALYAYDANSSQRLKTLPITEEKQTNLIADAHQD